MTLKITRQKIMANSQKNVRSLHFSLLCLALFSFRLKKGLQKNILPHFAVKLRLSLPQLLALPVLDDACEGEFACPSAELKAVSADYLDFLREQIRLGARGPEWNAVLASRLQCLEPLLDKHVLTVTFYRKPDSVTVRFDPNTEAIVQIEEC